MEIVDLDASRLITSEQLMIGIGDALGAPEWWGRNLDALWDIVTGDLAERKPPYVIRLRGLRRSSDEFSVAVDMVQQVFDDARIERGLAVAFEIA